VGFDPAIPGFGGFKSFKHTRNRMQLDAQRKLLKTPF